ncbi:hypothetical protein SAMN05660226_02279 [Parapedobacter luteus]|uniref:Uncharacterized protein n=1 Tax=Parapedobacter luteus TaxID=623280 RepID=A0A1T5CJS2_9SPHI|nr:hypothetical protein [Parapedobacter luteus]SKB59732.1 hypothetical protein SAMN05660226_02279 [Parapedobacter luteus]
MGIEMQYGANSDQLIFEAWDYGIIGRENDERCAIASDFIRENTAKIITFKYHPKEFKVQIDGIIVDKDDVNDELKHFNGHRVILDATSLDFAELLILLQSFKDLNKNMFSIIYIEPSEYNQNKGIKEILRMREFELCDESVGLEAIPGHSLTITNDVVQKVVFLCGFESERIDRALEDTQIHGTECCVVFGVPAFSPGWEMHSFTNNLTVMKDRRITGGVNYCGATDPFSVYNKLLYIYKGLEDDWEMFIAPFATKPMNIGACLFLVLMPKTKVAALYDHPQEKLGKGLGIGNWHLFNIDYNTLTREADWHN